MEDAGASSITLDSAQVRRLAFIKFLYKHGLQLLRQPEPLACSSLLLFHDAAELFLNLACEVHNVTRPNGKDRDFMEYWEALNKKIAPAEVSEKGSMATVNKARASLKHQGIMPGRLSLDSYSNTLDRFFNENTKSLFQLSFAEISLIDLVFPESARADLKEADNALRTNDMAKAAGHVAVAFQVMLDDYELRKRDRFGHSPFFFGKDLTFVNGSRLDRHVRSLLGGSGGSLLPGMGDLKSIIDSLSSTVQDLQSVLRIIALGIDFRRYSRFRYLTPYVSVYSGAYQVHEFPQDDGNTLTHEDVAFCMDFVIETSLLLQESDRTANIGIILANEGQP